MLVHALLALALALAAPAERGAGTPHSPTVDPAPPPEGTGDAVAPASNADPAAGSAPRDDVREQVRSHLGAIDRPVSAETWRALGPRAEPVLLEVAGSASEPPTRRARALEGLAALGGPRAEQVHLRLARERGAPPIVRSGAVRGLGRLLEPARLAGEVRPLLGDESARVRLVAGEVLARRAPVEACADVRAQAARERSPARWSRALRACAQPAAPSRARPRPR